MPQTREKVADGCWMAGIVSTGLRNLHLTWKAEIPDGCGGLFTDIAENISFHRNIHIIRQALGAY